jgi:hypothetical protein
MNTGQSLFTLAAMMLLTMIAMRVNGSLLQTQKYMQNSKFGVTAISLATSTIENANKLAFDEKTILNVVTATSGLTAVASLGPDAGETNPTNFDDFDDYNNYSYIDSSLGIKFYIRCTVCYINPTTPNVAATSPTWHKKITVYVSSPSMRDTVLALKDTVTVSSVFSYWKFR